MTIQNLIDAGVATDTELTVRVFDWAPGLHLSVYTVVDGITGSTKTIKSPMLVVFGGPNGFQAYQNTGYDFNS
jgi:hypothetical protein